MDYKEYFLDLNHCDKKQIYFWVLFLILLTIIFLKIFNALKNLYYLKSHFFIYDYKVWWFNVLLLFFQNQLYLKIYLFLFFNKNLFSLFNGIKQYLMQFEKIMPSYFRNIHPFNQSINDQYIILFLYFHLNNKHMEFLYI